MTAITIRLWAVCLLPVLFVLPACTNDHGTGAEPATTGSAASPAENDKAADSSPLAGTAWQLLRINSMDDTVSTPDDPAKYTLNFGPDGRVAVRADCNRGTGTWTARGASLEFGPIALTRAMCPPGSLHDTYVAQLAYVRSFVLEDGNLHLATMADGAIIDFAPLAE
jgi:para-nitrobenzyl esterase